MRSRGARGGTWLTTAGGGRVIGAALALVAGATVSLRASDAVAGPGSASAEDLERAVAVVEELERVHSFDAARRQLEALASLSEPEQAARFRLRRCELFVLDADRAQARACARAIAVAAGPNEPRALAAWLAATLAADLGDATTARTELRSLIVRAPWTVGATRAVIAFQALVREQGGRRAEMEALLEVAASLGQRPTVPDIDALAAAAERELFAGLWVGAGRAALDAGDAARAVAILSEATGAAAGTAWADDAAYWRAQALRASGRLADALAVLEALRDGKLDWPAGGVEDSTFYDRSLFDIGSILAALGRPAEAVAAWTELGRQVPESRLRDDADFAAARLAFAGGDRALLDRFVTDHPDSRFVPAARLLLERR